MVVGEKRRDEGECSECNKKLKEESYALMEEKSMGGDCDDQISIFVHVTGVGYWMDMKYVSWLYELKMDANKYYQNLTNDELMLLCSEAPNPIQPTLVFTYQDKYPKGMACVLVDSKLYFMGGSLSYTVHMKIDEEGDNETDIDMAIEQAERTNLDLYPSFVHVYDLITRQYHPNKFKLKSGKSANPLTFVADGKIFVLSIAPMPSGSITFESFDPNTGMSHELDTLPFHELDTLPFPSATFYNNHLLYGSALIHRQFFVSFTTKYSYPYPFIMFMYDLDTSKWIVKLRPIDSIPPIICHLYPNSLFVQNTLYSPCIFKLRHLISYTPLDPTHNLNFHDSNVIRIFKEDVKCWPIFLPPHASTSTRLVHLGGLLNGTTTTHSRCFAYVLLCQEDYPDPILPETTHFLRFVAFEDIGTTINERGRTFFRTRTLDSSHFSSTGRFDFGYINAAHAFRA